MLRVCCAATSLSGLAACLHEWWNHQQGKCGNLKRLTSSRDFKGWLVLSSRSKKVKTQESHPREWVDCSGPTYLSGLLNLRIPPTEVGGLFRSNLFVHVKGQ